MPQNLASLNALLEALKRSSGEQWYWLLTVTHTGLAAPIRLANPSSVAVLSNGVTYSPSRFDLVIGADGFDGGSTRAQITVDAVDGTLLSAIQALSPSPVIDIRLITESEPDIVQLQQLDMELARISVEGVSSMFFELQSRSTPGSVFPSLRMTRDRLPGIFTN